MLSDDHSSLKLIISDIFLESISIALLHQNIHHISLLPTLVLFAHSPDDCNDDYNDYNDNQPIGPRLHFE